MIPPDSERFGGDRASDDRDARAEVAGRAALPFARRPPPRPGVPGVTMGLTIQYWSELMTSPPWADERAAQVGMLIVFLKNDTRPSAMAAFTPPGWKLRAAL